MSRYVGKKKKPTEVAHLLVQESGDSLKLCNVGANFLDAAPQRAVLPQGEAGRADHCHLVQVQNISEHLDKRKTRQVITSSGSRTHRPNGTVRAFGVCPGCFAVTAGNPRQFCSSN